MTRRQFVGTSLALWLLIPGLLFALWAILRLIAPGIGEFDQAYRLFFTTQFFPDGANPAAFTPMAWFGIGLWLIIQAGVCLAAEVDGQVKAAAGVVLCAVMALLVFAVPVASGLWDSDKDHGRYYNSATTWHLPKAAPASARHLTDGAQPGTGRCDLIGHPGDMRTCIDTDAAAPHLGWEPRTASLSGALAAMTTSASPLQRVDVWDPTLTYLHGPDPGQGTWSAVLNGSGRIQPVYGVAVWDGAGTKAQVCTYRDGYRFGRAFDGERDNDLRNLIAEKYRHLVYDDGDIWGYCEAPPDAAGKLPPVPERRPVIVIPVQRQVPFEVRSVRTAAGVLILRGSASGAPAITYQPTVTAGQLPGPVYPLSLVSAQRQATEWAAGRRFMDSSGFGFEPATDETSMGNASEFLLKSTADGRLYYVTPLAPNASRSETVVGYALTRADEVTDGRLNALDVHLLADGDPLTVNVTRLIDSAQEHVAAARPTFVPNGGKLVEITPLSGDRWRIFGQRRGLTVLYVDFSATATVRPDVVDLSPSGAPAPPQPGKPAPADTSGCGRALTELPDRALIGCTSDFLAELQRRQPALP
ncbi:hypothetical protein ACFFMN_23340 [Planobispora siamensis]|uniref:Uncharacterized protein n=1 Tax=Planobispora siamensis TaxID=936338 RepID=A0A8J3WP70_9ACTN|nr:hypothetical protein [Planobispora siamensis]GIH95297.1 hypothetical protein Psi01_59270 [Planobispora siamensis]